MLMAKIMMVQRVKTRRNYEWVIRLCLVVTFVLIVVWIIGCTQVVALTGNKGTNTEMTSAKLEEVVTMEGAHVDTGTNIAGNTNAHEVPISGEVAELAQLSPEMKLKNANVKKFESEVELIAAKEALKKMPAEGIAAAKLRLAEAEKSDAEAEKSVAKARLEVARAEKSDAKAKKNAAEAKWISAADALTELQKNIASDEEIEEATRAEANAKILFLSADDTFKRADDTFKRADDVLKALIAVPIVGKEGERANVIKALIDLCLQCR